MSVESFFNKRAPTRYVGISDVMVDLETLGTRAGCQILSIGAVAFTGTQVRDTDCTFYTVINAPTRLQRLGLWLRGKLPFTDPETLQWWRDKTPEARMVLEQHYGRMGHDLPEALRLFNAWLAQFPGVRVWGNGADFDNPILISAYHSAGVPQGWGNWSGRCYRTLKSLVKGPKLVRRGVHHNALDDAISQAYHAVALLSQRAGLLPEGTDAIAKLEPAATWPESAN